MQRRDARMLRWIFSSCIRPPTTLFGKSLGQAAYVAANMALEALRTETPRRSGLPATCIGWGPIGDARLLGAQ